MAASGMIKQLNVVFREVFDDEDLVIDETTTAETIDEWDSIGHIQLILAVEKAFKLRFTTAEIAETKKPGQNVGTFARMIEQKCESFKG
jgi:acyl carrier protein